MTVPTNQESELLRGSRTNYNFYLNAHAPLGTENEVDVTAACDLADDLRDAIVEYQVSTSIEMHAGWFTHDAVYSLRNRRQFTNRTVD